MQRSVILVGSLALVILLIVLWSQWESVGGFLPFKGNTSPTPTATVSAMQEDQRTAVAVVPSAVTSTATMTPDMTATEEANKAVEAKEATQTAAVPTMTRPSTSTPSPTTTLTPPLTEIATASNTPTLIPTFTPTKTSTASSLLSYFTQEGDKKSLHILQSDGTSKTLVDGVVGIKVLDISPDGRYLALAVSATQEIVSNKVHTRFLNGSEVDLQVISFDGLESNVVLSGVFAFDARFGENGELFVATLDADTGVYRTVNYAVADTNGSNLHTFHSSENYFPPTLTPTYTPTPDSLTTYFTGDENSKSLHILNYDGTSTTLVENVSDIKILDMSPDRRYLALAISYEGVITGDGKLSRFVISPDLSLAVASMDTHEVKVILEVGSGIDARYSATDTLFIAHLNKISDTSAHISYLIAKADGSELREFYVSQNEFPNTPTPIPTDEG